MAALEAHRGPAPFGPAYQYLFEHDAHASGSVDRVLFGEMVQLCAETADLLYSGFTPTASSYEVGCRPQLEVIVRQAIGPTRGEARIGALLEFSKGLAVRAAAGDGGLVLGGTEEQIIARGTDWCVDAARVLCVLCQVAGVAARLVVLCNTAAAYSGHQIVEAYRGGAWGALDAVTGLAYYRAGRPATTWELMQEPELVQQHRRRFPRAEYTAPEQFRAAAIANYPAADWARYDYSQSEPNEYYREILAMAARGWPGGLRWLRGEDRLS